MPGDQRTPQARQRLSSLADGYLEVLGALPGASNAALLARIQPAETDPSPDPTLAVYKPRDGEAPLWDFPSGTLCNREVAAFQVADALGWPNVPPTILRDGPFGIGAVQTFVPFDADQHYFTLFEENQDVFRQIAAFDLVVNNADRKGGHCLRDEEGTIWAIDHGVCFAVEPKLRTVIWEFAGEPIPAQLQEAAGRLAGELRNGSDIAERLAALLSPEEVAATAGRAARLAGSPAFPEPDSVHAIPWPPI